MGSRFDEGYAYDEKIWDRIYERANFVLDENTMMKHENEQQVREQKALESSPAIVELEQDDNVDEIQELESAPSSDEQLVPHSDVSPADIIGGDQHQDNQKRPTLWSKIQGVLSSPYTWIASATAVILGGGYWFSTTSSESNESQTLSEEAKSNLPTLALTGTGIAAVAGLGVRNHFQKDSFDDNECQSPKQSRKTRKSRSHPTRKDKSNESGFNLTLMICLGLVAIGVMISLWISCSQTADKIDPFDERMHQLEAGLYDRKDSQVEGYRPENLDEPSLRTTIVEVLKTSNDSSHESGKAASDHPIDNKNLS